MKKIFLIFAATTLVCSLAMAQSVNPNAYENVVSVNGMAEKEVVPNEIWLSITINEKDSKGKITVEKQEKDMIAAFKRMGIDTDKQLYSKDVASSLQERVWSKNKVLTSKNYSLKLTSAARVMTVFDALEKLDISQVAVSKLTNSDLETYKTELRTEAMRQAKRIADELAAAVGQQVGAAVYISAGGFSGGETRVASNSARLYSAPKMMDAMAMEEDADFSPEFENLKLKYNVYVKFILK